MAAKLYYLKTFKTTLSEDLGDRQPNCLQCGSSAMPNYVEVYSTELSESYFQVNMFRLGLQVIPLSMVTA